MTQPPARSRARRIGILGGTFNPIHLGHLRSAEEVREAQGLDRVLFIPSASPPHKRHDGLASAAHRLAMVRRAVVGNPFFKVSTIEIERSGHSYSVDTLRALRAHMPRATFSFIMGTDAFLEIDTWKDYATIFELCDLVVTSRPPHAETALMDLLPVAVRDQFCYPDTELTHRTGNRILFQHISGLDISASAIRERLAAGLSIRYLVPAAVERYIAHHGLYRRRVG
ncbi:MAG: nicotinate-nucleotide adenylyltransferase [Deltaproteobacteria bacterium]|nr:nicotinate-nucleotide adenylyltransferase [Deltaproteobacteria bacterium]